MRPIGHKGQAMKTKLFFIDLTHAVIFAAVIGAPFAAYFIIYGA